jgi:hypothetical protein
MKSWTYIASAIGSVFTLTVAGAVSAATSSPLDPLLVPAVHADETIRYSEEDRLTGAVKHTHAEAITYHVMSNENGILRFQRDISGKGKVVFERDPSGGVDGGAKPGVVFFLPRQLLGDPPSPLAVGQTWQVRLPVETSLGSPGTASMSVVSIDQSTRHVVLHASLRGEGDSKNMTPGDNTPTTFHTLTNRQATIELSNGIIDSYVVAGDDRQSANGSTPANVHIEIRLKRAK